MVPTELELVSLIESTRISVNLQCLRAAALDVPWGARPRSSGAASRGSRWGSALPRWKCLCRRVRSTEVIFPPWKLSPVTKPRLTAWCLSELSAFAQQCLELGPQALHWVTKCKPLF